MNRVTRDIKEAAAKHGPKALQALVKLLDAPDPKIRTVAAREILDRAYGRPMTPTELTGRDGAPLVEPMSDSDLARMVVFSLAKATRGASSDAPLAQHDPEAARKRIEFEQQERASYMAAQSAEDARRAADEASGVHWNGDRKIVPGWREAQPSKASPTVITERSRHNGHG